MSAFLRYKEKIIDNNSESISYIGWKNIDIHGSVILAVTFITNMFVTKYINKRVLVILMMQWASVLITVVGKMPNEDDIRFTLVNHYHECIKVIVSSISLPDEWCSE